MSDFTEDFNGMLKRVFVGCDEFSVEIAAVTGFKAPYEALKVISGEIDDLIMKKRERITGRTLVKHVNKHSLSSLAGDLATITCGYAHSINDLELAKDIDYSYNKLLQLRDEEISKDCRIIYDKAFAHKTELLNYGITADKFTELDTMITDWDTNSQLNLVAWKQKRIYTAQLLAKVKEGKGILENILDKLIIVFKVSCPNLVSIYNTTRHSMMRNYSRRVESGTVLGFVFVKDMGIPITAIVNIKGATVEKRLESDMDGEYTFTLPIGIYTITAYKADFITKVVENVELKKDEDTLVNFELEKVTPAK